MASYTSSNLSRTSDIPFNVCFLGHLSQELITPTHTDDYEAFNIQECPTAEQGKHTRWQFS